MNWFPRDTTLTSIELLQLKEFLSFTGDTLHNEHVRYILSFIYCDGNSLI